MSRRHHPCLMFRRPAPAGPAPVAGRRQALGALSLLLAVAWPCVRAEPQPLLRAWPRGRATPSLDLPAYEGPAGSPAAARGKVMAINFWASWCGPCRTEMPSLDVLAERYRNDGLVVVAVNQRETDAAVRRFMEQMPIALAVLRDRDGAVAREWGVRAFPTSVLVDRKVRARFSIIGEADWNGKAARHWVELLLREHG